MILDLFRLNGLEGAQSDVKAEVEKAVAPLDKAVDDGFGKMQAGGRGGRRVRLGRVRIDGLVAFLVQFPAGIPGTPLDVRRQGHFPFPGRHGWNGRIVVKLKTDEGGSVILFPEDPRGKGIVVTEFGTHREAFAGSQEAPPLNFRFALARTEKEAFDLAAACAPGAQASFQYHNGVAEKAGFPGQQIRQFAEKVIGDLSGSPVHQQQPGFISLIRGHLGNRGGGQLIIEIGRIHIDEAGQGGSALQVFRV